MVFSSLTFLYLFLPLVVISYFVWKNRVWQNTVLLVFSLVFYAWGEPKFVVLMIAAALVAYVGGILIDRFRAAGKPGAKRAAFLVTVVLLTGNLFVFKYFSFVMDNVKALFHSDVSVIAILLPIGISFYTFQILSYVFDLYRGEIRLQTNFFYLLLYLSFFPQLIAGPIVRYQTVEDEIRERETSFDNFVVGLKRFIIGLAKKVIIANNVAVLSNAVYDGSPRDYGTAMYWLAAICYAFQIYYDFSGYSDMAIGLGRMFGFHFLENFDYPYISRSITEFWRRWHISLSTWFRDYIYIPLGGNRVSKGRWMLNILLVWGLTGLWHGAAWNFVLWGLYYAVLLMAEKLFLGKVLAKLPAALSWLYTMLLVIIGWVLFDLTDLSQVLQVLKTMFVFRPVPLATSIAASVSVSKALIYLPLAALFSFPWLKKIRMPDRAWVTASQNAMYLGLFALCLVYCISSTYNPFIYFRF